MAGHEPPPAATDLLLRDVAIDDIPIFFEHELDSEASQMAAFPARAKDAHAAHWAKVLADETVFKKTIVCRGASLATS